MIASNSGNAAAFFVPTLVLRSEEIAGTISQDVERHLFLSPPVAEPTLFPAPGAPGGPSPDKKKNPVIGDKKTETDARCAPNSGYSRKWMKLPLHALNDKAQGNVKNELSPFVSLTELATRLLNVSMAAITVADEAGREELVASTGLDKHDESVLCAPTHMSTRRAMEDFIISDTRRDQISSDAVNFEEVKSIAGFPLENVEGKHIGTFYVMDKSPGLSLGRAAQTDMHRLCGITSELLLERKIRSLHEEKLHQATRVVSATCNELLSPLSAAELALSLLHQDTEFLSQLSGQQREMIKIAFNCVGTIGSLCRGMRDQHSANCTRQITADPLSAGVRNSSISNKAETTFSRNEQAGRTNSAHNGWMTSSVAPFSMLPRRPVDVRQLIQGIHRAIDSVPKTIPVTIAVHPLVPRAVVTEDVKVLRCAFNVLQRCAAISIAGTVCLSVQPQYCRCGKATLEFHCQNKSTKDKIEFPETGNECCSALPGCELGKNKTSESLKPLLCCHNRKNSKKSLRKNSEINVFSVALQMEELGGDCGIGTRNDQRSPEDISFWFRIPLIEPCNPPSEHGSLASNENDSLVQRNTDSGVAEISKAPEAVANSNGLPLVLEAAPRKRRALVIDDSIVIRKVITNALSKIGIESEVAVNGMEGLHHMQHSIYDVVLCDFLMPVMDGLDCVTQYRAWEKEHRPLLRQYIIGMSAHASDRDVQKGIEAGMDCYKPKPLTYNGLKDIVEACEVYKQKLIGEKLASIKSTCVPTPIPMSRLYDPPQTKICLIASRGSTCDALASAARQVGWRSLIVCDGEEAIHSLQKRNWDAVFVDEKLPLLDGRECIKEFRRWESGNRVNLQANLFLLVASAAQRSGDEPEGVYKILQKPIQPLELEKELKSAEMSPLGIIIR